jgi:hypothetical protein
MCFRAFCVFCTGGPSTVVSTVARGRTTLTWGFATGETVDVYRLASMRSANCVAAAAPMPGNRCW